MDKVIRYVFRLQRHWFNIYSHIGQIVQHDICSVCGIFWTDYLTFSSWVVPIFLLEKCWITLSISWMILNLYFDVLSVICRLHNLWSPFKISLSLGPPIVFSFRAHTFLRTICRFSWNGKNVSNWRYHDNRHMNTSADVSKFNSSPFLC
jgi:hypothetical protein